MRTRQDSGFTLLEICIAIAIFAIGILTAMSVLVPAVRWGAEAKNDFTAAEAALSAAEFLQAGGTLGAGNLYLGPSTYKGAASAKDFYPFAVQVTMPEATNHLTAKVPADVVLKVYRRKLDADADDGSHPSLSTVTADNVVSSGGTPTVIFETHLKLYRP